MNFKRMSTIELDATRATLAREILISTNEAMINNMWLLLKTFSPSVSQTQMPKKRKLGILDGKAKVVFRDDWSMTTEELLNLQ
ncbi:hypothetical protein FACS189452_04920 [Bacteroidia bacterium]|nr:hypothetical protein FACS189452_04920 [Bacteroidia bacterium]GHT81528.1 hypothetical protein FACS189467_5740 [Bacteroidia bacterium]